MTSGNRILRLSSVPEASRPQTMSSSWALVQPVNCTCADDCNATS